MGSKIFLQSEDYLFEIVKSNASLVIVMSFLKT